MSGNSAMDVCEFQDRERERLVNLCLTLDLGPSEYESSLSIQNVIVERRKKRQLPDCLIFVEYSPIITLGKSGSINHLLITEEELRKKGIEFYWTNRGGDITYHGPGQLIAYPILDLKDHNRDVGRYLRDLESVIIATLSDFGISGHSNPRATGVWVGEEKLAAIGVRTSQWVTSHGLALNVSTDLAYFDLIIPCGLNSTRVTSMSKILGKEIDISEVKGRFCFHFGRFFEKILHPSSPLTSVAPASLSSFDKSLEIQLC
jgi:lipoyl(octanoyl) transferase